MSTLILNSVRFFLKEETQEGYNKVVVIKSWLDQGQWLPLKSSTEIDGSKNSSTFPGDHPRWAFL